MNNINFYLDNGFKIFPLQKGGKQPALKGSWKKHATTDLQKIEKWKKQGYNLAGTVPENIIILDADERDGGFASLKKLDLDYNKTAVVASPNGYHIYYDYSKIEVLENIKQTVSTLGRGIDIRIKGGYIVAAGSTRDDGNYNFLYDQPIKKLENQLVIDILSIPKRYKKTSSKGERNAYLAKEIGGHLRGRGFKGKRLATIVKKINDLYCDPPLPEKEVKTILGHIEKDFKKKPGAAPDKPVKKRSFKEKLMDFFNDYKDLIWFAGSKQENYIYSKKKRIWLPYEYAIQKILKRGYAILPGSARKIKSEFQLIVEAHCSKGRELPKPGKWLIPFNNCVFDLQTNKPREYRKDDYFTYKLSANYIETSDIKEYEAKGKSWIVEKMRMWTTADLNRLLQVIGLSLLSHDPCQLLFFLIGAGRNGKSTYLSIVRNIVGDGQYSSIDPQEMEDPSNFNLIELFGKHINVAGDIGGASLKNTSTLKKLTGGDSIKANRKFKEPLVFRNSATLVFAANDMPAAYDNTYGWKRRLVIVRFDKTIDKSKVDRQLMEKIGQDREALDFVARLALDLLIDLKKNNFKIKNDTLREEIGAELAAKPLDTFITYFCETPDDYDPAVEHVVVRDSYKTEFHGIFNKFAEAASIQKYSKIRLNQAMPKRGFKEKHPNNRRVWEGVGIRKKYRNKNGAFFKGLNVNDIINEILEIDAGKQKDEVLPKKAAQDLPF